MIKKLEIRNFKSVKLLRLDCKRVNVFIGKPNTGKSNILESLGTLSLPYGELRDFVRFDSMSNLFYDQNLDEDIRIEMDKKILKIKFKDGQFKTTCSEGEKEILRFNYDYDGKGGGGFSHKDLPFKFYRFASRKQFSRKEADFLLPPSGDNLLSILLTRKELRKHIAQIFSEYGLRIVLKPQENKIEAQKEIDDVIVSLPYDLISDTLQRIIFYLVAIDTNKDSVIAFEEPEAHAFPYYTKYLAERIALDIKNQYFISTHNPYFLLSVLEKSSKEDIAIFVTYFKNRQTKVKPLNERDKKEILQAEMDVFFDIERFVQ